MDFFTYLEWNIRSLFQPTSLIFYGILWWIILFLTEYTLRSRRIKLGLFSKRTVLFSLFAVLLSVVVYSSFIAAFLPEALLGTVWLDLLPLVFNTIFSYVTAKYWWKLKENDARVFALTLNGILLVIGVLFYLIF